jgi:hypothetical protein
METRLYIPMVEASIAYPRIQDDNCCTNIKNNEKFRKYVSISVIVIWFLLFLSTLILMILSSRGEFRNKRYVSGCECYKPGDVWILNNNATLCCTHDSFPEDCRSKINYDKVFIDDWVGPYFITVMCFLIVIFFPIAYYQKYEYRIFFVPCSIICIVINIAVYVIIRPEDYVLC